MKTGNQIILHTGSNMGNRIANLQTANALIKKRIGRMIAASKYYETAAWGITDQPDFINQALRIATHLSAQEVLVNIQAIETAMGRIRQQKWGKRLIDIDLIFYAQQVVEEENLQVPHPFLQERNFVLVPLQEIAADWIHPVLQKSVAELYEQTIDPLAVVPFASSVRS